MPKNPNVVICVPARMGSTRFPGKVLARLGGRPVVQWVCERASQTSAGSVIVATDSLEVLRAVEAFGGKAVMTSPDHPSGTDRIMEATSGLAFDVVVNVQGDEPFIDPGILDRLIDKMLSDSSIDIGTLVTPAPRLEVESNPNAVKAVVGADGFALYFTRAPAPFLRTGGVDCGLLRHIGVYAYRREALERFVSLPPGRLEECERLEQLRALENGMRIFCLTVKGVVGVGIDTPEDLAEAERLLVEMT